MSAFFAQVVKQVASPSIEIRKLASDGSFLHHPLLISMPIQVYIYLLR